MSSEMPTINFLGSKGKKVIVECGGHVFSVPLEDVRDLPKLEHPTRRSYYALDRATEEDNSEQKPIFGCQRDCGAIMKPANTSDSMSETSESEEESFGSKEPRTIPTTVHSSTASQVLVRLKDEVTRLIDESIEKIEQDLAEKAMMGKEGPSKAQPPAQLEPKEMEQTVEDAPMPLHPDGDPGLLNYREQNLQVLYTKTFVESKRVTRMKLLDEIRSLVERLKDMEMLE